MMRFYTGLISILIIFCFISCGNSEIGNSTPYNLENRQIQGKPKFAIEKTIENGRVTALKAMQFDENGNLVSEQNEKYKTRKIRKRRRRIFVTDTLREVFVYDYNTETGFLQAKSSNTTTFDLVVDEDGNLKEERVNAEKPYTISYIYNPLGLITCRTQIGDGEEPYTFDYQYRDNGQLLSYKMSSPLGTSVVYDCDTLGNVISSSTFNKNGKETQKQQWCYTFDEQKNWTQKFQVYHNGKQSLVATREYEYFSNIEYADINQSERKQIIAETNRSKQKNYIQSVKERYNNFHYFISIGSNKIMLSIAGVLMGILLVYGTIRVFMYFWKQKAASKYHRFAFWGYPDQKTGMRRLWVYNKEPYCFIGSLFLIAIGSFLGGILLMFLCGAIVWGFLWVGYAIIYIIAFSAVIGILYGLYAFFFSENNQGRGCLLFIIGVVVCCCEEALLAWGKGLTVWGSDFYSRTNMLAWTRDFFAYYWDMILWLITIPFLIFGAVAIVSILFSLILMGLELVITHFYGIHQPCPSCGNTKRFLYIHQNKEHPVQLRPGLYGIFHQTRYKYSKADSYWVDELYRFPTMLFNGKGMLVRKCPVCQRLVNPQKDVREATDCHVGIVGHRSSGKSFMLYKGLGLLMQESSEKFEIKQVDKSSDTDILENYKRLHENALPGTDRKDMYRAIQIEISVKRRPYPYHFFFYDVAGEKFSSSNKSMDNSMFFYKNVQTIVFIIDPSMIDSVSFNIDQRLSVWIDERNETERYDVDDVLGMVREYLEAAGRKRQEVDLIFTLAKADLGYFERVGMNHHTVSEEGIHIFMRDYLGMANLINNATPYYRSIGYATLSSVEKDPQRIKQFFHRVLEQRGLIIAS